MRDSDGSNAGSFIKHGGFLTIFRWHKNYLKYMKIAEKEGKSKPEPECRLIPAIFGAPLVTIGLYILFTM